MQYLMDEKLKDRNQKSMGSEIAKPRKQRVQIL